MYFNLKQQYINLEWHFSAGVSPVNGFKNYIILNLNAASLYTELEGCFFIYTKLTDILPNKTNVPLIDWLFEE